MILCVRKRKNSYLCTQLGRADELGTVCSDTCGTDCSASMVPITVIHLVPIQRYQQLEECKELNEEKKVRDTFSPMCHPGDTIYFICHLIIEKGNKYLAFWKKHKGRKTDFSDVKGYTYAYHKRKGDIKNSERNDSVVIFSNPFVNINIASEKIISTCNRWDTVTLKTNKTLDGDDYEDSYRSAYRVILKKSGRFSIQYVKIVNQGHPIIRSPDCVISAD